MKTDKIDGKTIVFPQLRGSAGGLKYPALAEIKYDGELNYIHINESDAYTINKYGTMRRDFPMLNNIVQELKDNKVKSCTMICELYWNDGKMGELYNLLSHKKDDNVGLKIFDIIELDGEDTRNEPLVDRREAMHEIGLNNWLTKCWVVNNKQELEDKFNAIVVAGYEGCVAKDLDTHYVAGPCSWVKMKYKDQSDYMVFSIDPTKERIEVLVPNATTNSMVQVGVKAPNRYKKYIKLGEQVTIEHQGVLDSGSLRHPVLIPKKEWK